MTLGLHAGAALGHGLGQGKTAAGPMDDDRSGAVVVDFGFLSDPGLRRTSAVLMYLNSLIF